MRNLSETKTLLLNADYTPLKVRSWQQAIVLLYVKKVATGVDFYSDIKIRDGHRSYPVPAVIVLKKYVRQKNTMLKCSRRNVIIRDQLTCQYCNKKFSPDKLNLDHVIPLSHWEPAGGKDNPTNFLNVVASCYTCNNKKGNRLGVNPVKPPRVPNMFELAQLTLGINPYGTAPIEWKPYLTHYSLFKELEYVSE